MRFFDGQRFFISILFSHFVFSAFAILKNVCIIIVNFICIMCATLHCIQINAFTNVFMREDRIRLRVFIREVSNKILFRRIPSVNKLYSTILWNFQTFLPAINSRKSQTQDIIKGRDGATEKRKRRIILQQFDTIEDVNRKCSVARIRGGQELSLQLLILLRITFRRTYINTIVQSSALRFSAESDILIIFTKVYSPPYFMHHVRHNCGTLHAIPFTHTYIYHTYIFLFFT